MRRIESDFPGSAPRLSVAMLLVMLGFTAAVAAQAQTPATQPSTAPAVEEGFTRTGDNKLLIRLTEVPIKRILDEFCRVSGLTLEPEIPIPDRNATIVALSPISVADAVETINALMSESGQAVVQDGAKLKVVVPGNTNTPLAIPHEKLMVLAAIVIEDGRYTAYVDDRLTKKILRLQSGDGVLDGIVVEVQADQLLVNRQGKRSTIRIGQNFES
jgi:hypothetical protein